MFCLSIVCLFRPPWLPQHLWLPVSLGLGGGREEGGQLGEGARFT